MRVPYWSSTPDALDEAFAADIVAGFVFVLFELLSTTACVAMPA